MNDCEEDVQIPMAVTATSSIDELFDAFLTDQRARLKDKTFNRYVTIVQLFRTCLNSYGHTSLYDASDMRRWEQASESDEEAFCHLFGAEAIIAGLGEFLDYFMIRKVLASSEDLKAASTVTGKLVRWLEGLGLLTDVSVEVAREHIHDSKALPLMDKLASALFDLTNTLTLGERKALADAAAKDIIEDQLSISNVEAGKLYFDGVDGWLQVPVKVSALAQTGWSVNMVLARLGGRWRVCEVGNVYPY
ncbi:MAG: hypothetical protein U0904_00865 [Candidatus Nanopelagicales bacterium]|nr:hypothetical protein [Candidatus Nanopelagicales bacterium]